jgi:PKD domain
MAHQARPHHARLANVAIATMLGLAASAAAASGASASSAPVPDFDTTPSCLPDIIAISCDAMGSATGGGTIVSWKWEYPGAFGNTAEGQNPLLRFENTGKFRVTLTVTDDQDQTGTVTKTMVVDI